LKYVENFLSQQQIGAWGEKKILKGGLGSMYRTWGTFECKQERGGKLGDVSCRGTGVNQKDLRQGTGVNKEVV